MNYSNAYAYDLCGNRIRKSTSGILPETINYAYNKNDQLTSEASNVKGNTLYQYDDNGCLTSKTGGEESCAYSYNLQGRMSGATISRVENGQNVTVNSSYTYDVSGIRTRASQTVNGVVQNRIFLNDGMNHTGYSQVLEESTAVGATPVKSYVLGDDILSQTSIINSQFSTVNLLSDGHGSTRLLTDNAGIVTDRYDFDAYGMMSGGNPGATNPATTDMLYSGEQFDSELQMQYLRARYYDQNNGRFNRVDDFAGNNSDPQSLHKYAYCHGDPVNGIDPSGNCENIPTLLVDFSMRGQLMAISLMALTTSMVVYRAEVSTFVNSLLSELRLLFAEAMTTTTAIPIPLAKADDEAIPVAIPITIADTTTQKRNPKRKAYLHYSHPEYASSLISQGLWAPSWATRRLYLTGWEAKLRLALPSPEPPTALFLVVPKPGFEHTYEGTVMPKEDREFHLMPGGGYEYRFGEGSGGPGTVFDTGDRIPPGFSPFNN